MERFAQKERVLTSPFSPPKEPDIDFNDVFGGPPKRSTSSHESRRNSRSLEDDDEAFLQRNPWSGVREKPVFGEESVNRRKYPSDDFYEDIFRGDEVAGSPRRASQEAFGSGFGGLSPVRPLPPRTDPYGSSLPTQIQFSLPTKLTRGTDPSTISSGNRKYKEPISSTKGFLYTPSPLSHEASLIKEAPFITQPEEKTKSSELKSDSKNTEVGNQFHFSIYKWASKGVPVLMLQRGVKSGKLRDAIKSEILSSFHENIEKSDFQELKRDLSGNNKVHHAEEMKQDKNVEAVSRDSILSDKKAEKKAASRDSQEPQVKSLRSFLGNSEEEVTGKVKTSKKSEQKANAKKKATVSDTNEDIRKKVQMKEPQSVDSKRGSRENIERNKSKGKVKEFVKIFNQEVDSKTKNDSEKRNISSEIGSAASFFEKADVETSAKTSQMKASVMLDKKIEEPMKQHSHLNASVADLNEKSTDRNNEKASNLESHPENSQAIDEDVDDIHANFTVQELSTDQENQVLSEDNYEDIHSSDARIRKWSRGKEGNIRSLLSTLQYVLWPGSGWKPVPLVDIIEGNAVKRSYQRAMLCLHPDKLQQKGAADYQKYIAEKVFDILQEAWDQFNSLGLV